MTVKAFNRAVYLQTLWGTDWLGLFHAHTVDNLGHKFAPIQLMDFPRIGLTVKTALKLCCHLQQEETQCVIRKSQHTVTFVFELKVEGIF